ncbi:MAG TPA: hypothetical protein VEN30_00065 [Paraburkholderia sp.]|nr:hypothetical protein [Paraburkholderia sp.]
MTAFLLIWSPKKWPWPELPEVAKRVAAGVAVTDVWGCGFARGILPGDRVFLHRVAQEPKGIFGSGYVTRAPYEVPDPATKRGYRLCIDFVYDWLVDAREGAVITREALRTHPFSVQTWDAQSSGTVIKPIAEGALEKRWAELTGKRKPPKFDAAPAGPIHSSKVTAHAAAAKKSAAEGRATSKPKTSVKPSNETATTAETKPAANAATKAAAKPPTRAATKPAATTRNRRQ